MIGYNILCEFLYDYIDMSSNLIKKVSCIFTVHIDPFRISNEPIKFKGSNEYGGYHVVGSLDEKYRRMVHWFYRNVEIPSLNDWKEFMELFNINEIPSHTIQLYTIDREPLEKFILIHAVTDKYIHYTYENKEDNTSITVTVPIGTASLIPEKLLFNLKLFSRQ